MSDAETHHAVEPLSFLIGRWRGQGDGEYPTIEPFTYGEEIEFSHSGRAFLFYQQKTWDEKGCPLHSESGYVRPVAEGQVELVLSQPSGITEILTGSLLGTELDLTSTHVGVAPTAKEVSAVRRKVAVEGRKLDYTVDMAAVGREMSIHLRATLERVE